MNKLKIARELVRLAEKLCAAETGPFGNTMVEKIGDPERIIDKHFREVKRRLKEMAKVDGQSGLDYTQKVFKQYKNAAIAAKLYKEAVYEAERDIYFDSLNKGKILDIIRN